MSKRLTMLEQLVSTGKADSFARYALALEYKSAGRNDDAMAAFTALREADPGYLAMYLMAGQLAFDTEDLPAARDWLNAGHALAVERGESKAQAEIEALLANCD